MIKTDNSFFKNILLYFFSLIIYPLFAQSTISVDHDQLNFGAINNGPQTPLQSLLIDNSGTGTLNWAINTSDNWIIVHPENGMGSGIIEVFIDVAGLPVGEHFGTISIVDNSATNSPLEIPIKLEVYAEGGSSNPFGNFDTPVDGSTVSGMINITGWALDDLGVTDLTIYKDIGNGQEYSGLASFVEGARPDVNVAYPDYPYNYQAGWGFAFLTNFLPNGPVTLYAQATDIERNNISLGSKTVYIDNANAVKPFGDIDTPSQGGLASGTEYPVWGWVLTPQPNTIPADGSTIKVYIDGVMVGYPNYGLYREDIATLLPGYNNSNGAGCSYLFDTTLYSNGIHTIQWIASDNVGNTDGIGSRYFTIYNNNTLAISDKTSLSIPTELALLPAYPNPFNPSTTITYGISNDSQVKIEIYDLLGKLVSIIFNGEQTQGWHSIEWDGTNQHGISAPAGIYISKVTSNNTIKTSKLMLLK